MKVIDLLNKIAKGEEVPQKIKYNKEIFIYDKKMKDYINVIDEWYSETLLFKVMYNHYFKEILETKIEILEDNAEEIEELGFTADEWYELNNSTYKITKKFIEDQNYKLNEVIRAVNKLKESDKNVSGMDENI